MLKGQQGLAKKEAEKRLQRYGYNELEEVSKVTPIKILLRQIKSNFIIYLLLAAMIISFLVDKAITAYVILAVILVVIITGFVQEYRSEKAIHALKSMLTPVSLVIRDGKEIQIPSKNIVPGDILILRTGDRIPADCILLEGKELRVDESVLTGESAEIKKTTKQAKKNSNENLLFMGTFVVNGKGIAKVLHTGMDTRFGKIANLISSTEKELPLQKKVNKIVRYIALIGFSISVLTGAIVLARSPVIDSEVIVNVAILIIALTVASFPESFPVVLITTLSSGAYRMAKQNAIVNRMSIIETLGETTIICSDKTGTITKGEMTVKKIFSDNSFFDVSGTGYDAKGDFYYKNKKIDIHKEAFFGRLFNNMVLCNDSQISRTGQGDEFSTLGSPTESALLILAAKAGLFKEDIVHRRIHEMPFSSERKMMSVLCQLNGEKVTYVKGAPEYILKNCKFIQKGNSVYKLTEKEREKIMSANSRMARESLRTLAFAYKPAEKISKSHTETNLIFTGLVGMEDPPREGVKEALKLCKTAGISVKMITGDNKETAQAIAEQIGLHGALMEGEELEKLSDSELSKIMRTVSIFARVKPEHKLRIVRALKANGEIVTMTGDGVNDAPALKEAHVGVAMGKCGTDVSRSVADLTLKDDNFTTIVAAIREGRTIFKNIRKFVTYQLSCNFAELLVLFVGVLLAPFLGWQVPLLVALQILFMNLVTDDLPAITLGLNPQSKDAMKEKPRKNAAILNKKFLALLAFAGTFMATLVLINYYIAFNILGGTGYARTVALFTLISLEIVSAFNFRSFRKYTLTRSPLINPYLVYASLISLAATFAIIYTPLSKAFETTPIGKYGYLLAIAAAFIFLAVFDGLKYLNAKMKIVNLEA